MRANPTEWHASGKTIDFCGKPIFLQTAGEGPALLLIHGFPTASWDWCKLWSPLSQRFRLIAPDLLGLGFSAKPPGHRYTVAEQADLCESMLRHLGINACHVLAHDYGDTVAQELLARQNENRGAIRLASIAFLNGGLFPETHRPRLIQRLLLSPLGPLLATLMNRQSFGRSLRAIFGPNTPPSAFELDSFWALICFNNGRAALPRLLQYMPERRKFRERWVGALQSAQIPLALINGSQDPISGAHMVARYREIVATPTQIFELADIGHYPQIEDPAGVLAAFMAFQASTGG